MGRFVSREGSGRGRAPALLAPLIVSSWLRLGLLLGLSLCLGCASVVPADFSPPEQGAMIVGVPFHPQLDYQCGPASLAGVLNYWGDTVAPEDIAESVFRKDLRGTVSLDLALYPRERGFDTRFFRGQIKDLTDLVDAGTPPIVMIDQGLGPISQDHFMVVVGYAPEGIVANSGRSKEVLIPWESFLPQWSRAAEWTLVVTKKSRAGPPILRADQERRVARIERAVPEPL